MTEASGVWGSCRNRVLLWVIGGLLDVIYVCWAGYEGALYWTRLILIPVTIYLVLGFAACLIAWLLSSLPNFRRTEEKRSLPSLCWDAGVIFLLVVGFRINERLLPSIGDPKSVIGNLVLLLVTFGLVWLCGFASRRVEERKKAGIITLLVLALFLISGYTALVDQRGGPPVLSKPNVLLVTLDTVRADHLGCYGHDRDTSPNLDQFAEDNHLFTGCRTPMPLTSPAHASLFSGKMPHELGVFTNVSAYPDDPNLITIAEDLSDFGYRTAGFPAAVHMSKEFNFDRGFRTYNQSTILNGPGFLQDIYQLAPIAILCRLGIIRETFLARDSRQVNRAFLYWLGRHRNERFFAWVHYFDAHSPYEPPEEYWRRYQPDYQGSVTGSQEELGAINAQLEKTGQGERLPDSFTQEDIGNLRARYDGEIRYQDESLGELLDALRERGLWENTVIVIVSDHGEGLYDDGYFGHNFTLEEYEIRLALAIKGPDIDCPPDRPLGITDVTDYIRHVAGVASTGPTRLTGAPESDDLPDDPYTSMVFLRSHCWIDPPYKLVRTYDGDGQGVSYALYNFEDDPAEAIDLFDLSDERSTAMRDQLQEWLDANDADFPVLLKRGGTLEGIDPATLEMLRSLGYIY